MLIGLILLCCASAATSQVTASRVSVLLTVVDENDLPVPDARVSISEPGHPSLQLQTDYAGRCTYPLQPNAYQIQVEKPGFYQAIAPHTDAHLEKVEVVLSHEQIVRQQVNVVASTTGIDPEQTAGESVMNLPEIVNVPYPSHAIFATCSPSIQVSSRTSQDKYISPVLQPMPLSICSTASTSAPLSAASSL